LGTGKKQPKREKNMGKFKLYIAGAFIVSLLHFIVFMMPYWRRLDEKTGVNIGGVIVGLWTRCYHTTPGTEQRDLQDQQLNLIKKLKICSDNFVTIRNLPII